jgi:hypothetical protein
MARSRGRQPPRIRRAPPAPPRVVARPSQTPPPGPRPLAEDKAATSLWRRAWKVWQIFWAIVGPLATILSVWLLLKFVLNLG